MADDKFELSKIQNNLVMHDEVDEELFRKFQEAQGRKESIESFIQNFLGQFLSAETKKAYLSDLIFFFKFLKLGGLIVSHPKQIQGSHFQIYRDWLIDKKYSSATINRKLVSIRSFIKWALASNMIEYNPLDIVKLPKVQTTTPTLAFDDHEVIEMLNAPDITTKVGRVHKMAMHLLFSLGLRRAELINIKIEDIYTDRGHYVIRITGKGQKDRHLPLAPDVIHALKEYMDAMAGFGISFEPTDFLIQSARKGKNTRPMNGSTVYRIIEKYAKQCGINKKVSPHSCRATVISHLLDTQHTPIRDVAIFAGHSKITTTERYDKRRESLDKSAAYNVNYKKEA